MKKRILALLLALVLIVSSLPPVALAEGTQTPEITEQETQAPQVPEEEITQTPVMETAPVLSAVHGTHTCEHCSDSSVSWQPWEATGGVYPTSGHYYLADHVTLDNWVTLSGNVELTLCLNGCNITAAKRAFRMNNGAKLTICDCTGNGKIYAGASNGGAVGIFKDAGTDAGCTLKMYNITVEGVADKTPQQGGGVLVNDKGATVLLKNVDFKNLTIAGGTGGTTGGAAVYMSEGTASTGSLTMENCSVTGCTDRSPSTAAGAVRCIQVGTVSFKNCSFTGNSAVGGTGAGAVMLSGGKVTMEGCTVTGNSCTAISDWCGGIYVYSATQLTLKGKNVINGNTINNGANQANLVLQESAANAADGNLHFDSVDPNSVLNIKAKRATTDPNKLMNVTAGDPFTITYETDGKVYRYDAAQAKFVLQEHIHTEGYADVPVSAAWMPWEKTDSLPTSGYYYLTDNVVLSGAAVLNTNGAQLTLCLNGKTVTAPAAGRVFRVSNGHKLTVCDHTGTGILYAGASNGGAIALVNDAGDAGYCELKAYDITIEGTEGNVAKQGGGITCTNPHNNATLKNVTFKNLTVAGGTADSAMGGSAVFFYTANSDGELYMEGCTVTGCADSSTNVSGAVRVWQAASATLKNCTFTNNTNSGVGGSAVILSGAKEAVMEGCTVTGNTSTGTTEWAGAVYVFPSSQLTLKGRNIIKDNTAKNGAKEANLVLVETTKDAKDQFLHFADADAASELYINARRGTTDPNQMMNVTAGDETFNIVFDGDTYYYDTVQDKFVLGHKHNDGYAGVAGSVMWKPWTKTNELPNEDDPGYWYLTENVTVTDVRFAEIKNENVFVCLNGKTVTAKTKGSDGLGTNAWRMTGPGSLTVCDCSAHTENGTYTAGTLTGGCMGAIYTLGNVGATVNFYDGIISGNWTEGNNSGAAICIQKGSTLYLHGGLLTNNESSANGGAIYNSGTVNISGGEITGNTAEKIAGAVYTVSDLYISGGKITGNAGKDTSGGVFSGGGVLHLSGSPEITGNTLGTAANNIYLATGKQITLGEMGTGTDKIGVSVAASTLPRTFSNDMGSTDCTAYFFSDNADYEVVNKDNKLHLQRMHAHTDGYAGVAGSVKWLPWTSTNSLPTSGYYYLTANVNIANVRYAEIKNDDLYLCLNGKTITARAEGTDGKTNIFRLTGSGSLTICDCGAHTDNGTYTAGTLTGASMGAIFTMGSATGSVNIYDGIITGNTTNDSGAAAVIQNTCNLNIYGGEFTNNTATNNGGAVYIGSKATATVSGGTFSGNTAPKDGGAIISFGTLNLKGGKFTGNTAGTNGGAIHTSGVTNISGSPEITGNTVNGKNNNLYLATGKSIVLDTMGTGTAKIGVSLALNTLPRTFSNDMGSTDCTAYFFSDNAGYEVVNKDNKLHMKAVFIHPHDDEYAGVDESVDWQPWTSKTSLPTSGYWVLTEDVTLNTRFAEIKNDDLYLCLNGKTVTARAEGTDGKTNIFRLTGSGSLTICDCGAHTDNGVYKAGTLTGASMGAIFTMGSATGTVNIYDGIITGNTTNDSGAAAVIQNTCKLNIYGGEFTNNTATNNGGAVYIGNKATVTIKGGTFSGNHAPKDGGAIINAGSLYIQGGKFTGNTAGTNGGAIHSNGSVLSISGNPEITGNTVKDAPNNLYLAIGKLITLGELAEDTAKIGISVSFSSIPRFLSEDMGSKDVSPYFFSDDPYRVITVKDNCLYMAHGGDHRHCDCAGIGGDNCSHEAQPWAAWTDVNSLPTSGYWYLTGDVTVASADGVTVTGDLHLCLNGHKIDGDGHVILKIRNDEHDVVITDCQNGGEITNGSAVNYGAIYLEKGTFAMFGGKLTNNHCTQTAAGGWAGGAIQARGDVLLVGVQVIGNISDTEGGAICMRESAKATLVNCIFKNNEAANGGAIYAADGRNEVTLRNCIFEGNTAQKDGGAILVKGKLTVEEGSVFEKNTAGNCGGAVLVMSGGHFQLSGGKFTKNEAPNGNGGAVYISTGCTMTMDGGEILENTAKTSGGGIYLLSSTFTMNGGKISKNAVKYYGGAIAGEGAVMNLNGGEISKNKADQQAGALYAKYRVQGETTTVSEINIAGAKIAENESAQGGAIATIRYTKINLSAGSIENNHATKDAGAILLQTWSEMTITGGQITGNKADKACGGIYVSSDSKLTMSGGSISYNVAGTNGGGVALSKQTVFTITGGDITGNEAKSHGGGIYNVAGTVELKGGKIQKNYAKTQGGGIFACYNVVDGVTYKAAINIRSGSINNNKSKDGAGVATIRHTTVTMSGGSVSGNVAAASAGGLLLQTGSKLSLSGGSVSGNVAQKDSAGGIFISSECSMTMTGGAVSNNTCKGYGGGIYLMYANGSFTGGKIQGNKSTGYEAGGMYIRGTKVTLDGTDILDNYAKKSGGGIVTVRYVAESKGIDAQPELTIKSGRIANNHSDGVGGGMLLQSAAETKLLGGSIENNYCKSYGGGVYVSMNHTFTVTGGKITNNVSDGWGGGIYHLRGSVGKYENFELSYNKAASLGGGLIINGTEAQPSAVTMKKVQVIGNEAREGGGVRTQDRFQSFEAEGCVFKDNQATGLAGGLVLFFGLEDAKVKDCVFENNTAGTQGGGVYVMSAMVNCQITGCTFTGNTAGTEGGGLWTQGGILVKDCVFEDNHAELAGGAISTDVFANTRVRHPVLYVEGCEISNNTSGTNGGGIYADTASYVNISDTKITGNTSKAEGGGIWIVDDSTLHNVTVTGNKSGGEGYALYYHASEFDGLSYIRGAHKIGGEMIVKDNEGGNMYMGKQTGIAVSDKGLTGNTYMNIRLYSGYLTQLLRGAYNYEGGDTLYTVTVGNRSITEPEVYAQAQPGEEKTDDAATVNPVIWICSGVAAVAVIAIVVILLLLGKKKKAAAEK